MLGAWMLALPLLSHLMSHFSLLHHPSLPLHLWDIEIDRIKRCFLLDSHRVCLNPSLRSCMTSR